MNIGSIAKNLIFDAQGFWKKQIRENISYTEDGHNLIKNDETISFWFDHRKNCLDYVIGNDLQAPVLDVGGGNGLFSKFLQTKKIDSILIEPGIDGVNNAIKNGVKNIINSSLFDAEIVDESANSIVLLDVLEHIDDDEKFLAELNRILKDKGRLILTVPAYQFLFSDFDREVGHFRRYTLGNLQQKIINNGFKVEYKSYFFSLLPIPIFFGRFLMNKFKSKAKRKQTGHLSKNSLAGKILQFLLQPELFMIKHERRIPFGSSCIIVAQKVK